MILDLRSFFAKIGFDGAVAITVLTRIIQAGGGIVSVLLIAKFLSSDEQGYYYTFGSVLAIQVFFELGLSGIITQYTAHEFAHLELTLDNKLYGDVYHKSRVSSLLKFCVKCFGVLGFFLFFLLLIVGFYFFHKFNNNINIEWKRPWILLCFTNSLSLFIDPILAFFDGLGKVKDMAKVRLVQKVFYIVFLLLFLFFGFKLYATALASLLSILINCFQILFTGRIQILKIIWQEKKDAVVDYYQEILPFQWRIALSWISGYFIFQLFNPVLFATEGAKVAGQMGMTLAALGAISTLTMSWINTKVPLFSGLIAKKDYFELDIIFNKTVKQLFFISILLCGSFVTFIFLLKLFEIKLYERFLSPLSIILLSSTVIANQFISSWATYLRCHKKEPFLVYSVVFGFLCLASTFTFGTWFGLIGIVIGYTFLTVVVGLIWAYIIFTTKKQEWHD